MKDFAKFLNSPFKAEVIERLVRYAKVETTSDRHVDVIPSTKCQWDLANLLVTELKTIGVNNVELDEHCFVIGHIPASAGYENKPTIGLMAHVDTSSDVSGKDVKPRVVENYDGKKLELSKGIFLDPADFADLSNYVGDTIVVTDGTTLLGADDKSGIAVVMTAAAHILANPEIKHGPLYLIFSPDEETGKGMDGFPIQKIKPDACYTYDGGHMGEIEAECFTAYEAKVKFCGKASHPGYARGVMANAVSMAGAYISLLPRSESPESTDGWYGYYYAHEVSGALEEANVDILLRDFTDEGMARRQETLKILAKTVEAQFPGGKVTVEFVKQYLNMRKKLDENKKVLDLLFQAAEKAETAPYSNPIRGGTDGARLTEMGIPTPNIFAGMHNFHGRYEWASASEMVAATNLTVELIKLWAQN